MKSIGKASIGLLGAALVAALTLAAPAAQAHHKNKSRITLSFGGHGFHHHHRHRRFGYDKERFDVIRARNALRRQELELDRALAIGDDLLIRKEWRDVKRARWRLERELEDL